MEAEEGIVVDMVLEVCVEDSEGVCRVLVDQAEASGEGRVCWEGGGKGGMWGDRGTGQKNGDLN